MPYSLKSANDQEAVSDESLSDDLSLIKPINRSARWVFDFDTFRILEVNQAALDIFACSRDAFLNLDPLKLETAPFEIDEQTVKRQLLDEALVMMSLPFSRGTDPKELIWYITSWQLIERHGKRIVSVAIWQNPEPNHKVGVVSHDHLIELSRADDASFVVNPSEDTTACQDLEVQLRLSMSSAGAGTWGWDLKTQRISWSEEFFALLDRPYLSLRPTFEAWVALIHPDDRDRFRQQIEKVIQKQLRQLDVEYRLGLPNGVWRWINIKGRLFLDEQGHAQRLIGITIDITERRAMEQALRLNEQRYRSLAQATSALVWHANAEGNFQEGAADWLDYTGQAEHESLGDGWMQAFHENDRLQIEQGWRSAIREHRQFTIHGKLWHAQSQRYRDVAVHGVPVFDENDAKPREWIGTCIDITEQLYADEQRRHSLQREHSLRTVAEAANRALEHANRTKDEFLATLSHELRTPLTAIQGWAQVLRRAASHNEPETFKRAIAAIEESALAQTRLVEDLLNISDIVVGKLRLNIQPMVFKNAVEAALQTVRPAIDNKRILLSVDYDKTDTDTIFGDPARIQQIVWNLISNAVKFTPPEGTIHVRCTRTEQHVCLDIEDTGEGISAEFLPFVFDRFRQADSSSKRRHGGLGLGLAIVRYLTELHGGTVSADSAGTSRGSRFRIMLPIAALPAIPDADSELPACAKPFPAQSTSSVSIKGLRLVSVDDDRNTREMLEEALNSFGAHVSSAPDAQSALDLIEKIAPDVLISDIGMAGEDGYDLIRQLRQRSSSQGADTPAIALTGYARPQDQGLTEAAGFDAYLSKPVDLDQLVEVIYRLTLDKNRNLPANGTLD